MTKQITLVKPKPFISEKTKVRGSSSAWISDDTLRLMGGSLPPPGHGERPIFMYSTKPMDILTCGLEENCKVDVNFTGNTRLIECDVCAKDIQFYCDKKIIKLKKTPEFYKCPICSKNVKEKKTEKEERHLVLFKKNNNFELIKL